MRQMNLKKIVIAASAGMLLTMTACTNNSNDNSVELKEFRAKVDTFCTSIATVDSNINAIDVESTGYEQTMLSELDSLDGYFKEFAALDFPSDYDYLEGLADEASSYMDTAVTNYHDAFENDYSDADFTAKYNYAYENYSRAYKRIQIIVTFFNGEISDGVTVTN